MTQETWQHVAFVRESSGTIYMYLDGVKQSNSWTDWNGVSMQTATRNTLSIGARSGTTAECFVGNLDEFRYSNVAAAGIGNFLNYSEHSFQSIKSNIKSIDIRPAVYL